MHGWGGGCHPLLTFSGSNFNTARERVRLISVKTREVRRKETLEGQGVNMSGCEEVRSQEERRERGVEVRTDERRGSR